MDERTAAIVASIAGLIEANGLDLADVEAALTGVEDTSSPTVGEYIPVVLRTLSDTRTRGAYRTHLRRLADGIARVCSCPCEACAISYMDDGDCAWSCKACAENPLDCACAVSHARERFGFPLFGGNSSMRTSKLSGARFPE
jgi:hypothetical protein